MKKMTLKEFKEAVNEISSFDIVGWEGILAMIERTCWENSKEAKRLGCETVFERERERANKLHDILEERGYYDV